MVESHYYSATPPERRQPGTVKMRLGDLDVDLATDRGVFAADELDRGTRHLLDKAPWPTGAGPFLDLGCGYGPIAVALARRAPGATLWAVDVNPRALELCQTNLSRHGGDCQSTVCRPEEVPPYIRFEGIYSNPPIRIGKKALHDLLETWLARLTPTGHAWLVIHKHLGSDSLSQWLTTQGWDTTRLGSKKGYRLLKISPHPPT